MDKHTLDESQLLELFRRMTLLRRFEEKIAGLYVRGKITGHVDLYGGEEAVGVGAICALDLKDYVVSTYRQYGHCLAKCAAPRAVMAELFGKQTGISHGRDGAMHTVDPNLHFIGAIGAGGLPIATGLALAVQYQEGPEVVFCIFGDTALSQGAFHEALNLASIWKLPIVFICENNFYGMGTFIDNSVCQEELYRFAEPYKMPGVRVDGMDVVEVYIAAKNALSLARAGEGPSLIEAVTYRFRGASMSNPAEDRAVREERIWRERDPIMNLRRRLLGEHGVAEATLDRIDHEVDASIDDAVKFAEESPEPPLDTLGKTVYASDH